MRNWFLSLILLPLAACSTLPKQSDGAPRLVILSPAEWKYVASLQDVASTASDEILIGALYDADFGVSHRLAGPSLVADKVSVRFSATSQYVNSPRMIMLIRPEENGRWSADWWDTVKGAEACAPSLVVEKIAAKIQLPSRRMPDGSLCWSI